VARIIDAPRAPQIGAGLGRERRPPSLLDDLRADIGKKLELHADAQGRGSRLALLMERGTVAVVVYRFGRWARALRVPVLRAAAMFAYYALFYLVQMFTGISIQAYAAIGPGFVVRNFSCIFVLAESIGSNFTVCEGVTVGNIRGAGRLPVIGDNVYLEPGCKVLGAVTIGDNVVVRANSLVISDIPAGSIAIGNPARAHPRPPND